MKIENKKTIVVGSGFGGIAAALRLRAKMHDVTLIEKHNDLGGRARVFRKNGFIFDAGPTVITAPYLINELFELFNSEPDYRWESAFNIIGIPFGLIFVGLILFAITRELIKEIFP